jgi:hypothetical protein
MTERERDAEAAGAWAGVLAGRLSPMYDELMGRGRVGEAETIEDAVEFLRGLAAWLAERAGEAGDPAPATAAEGGEA